MATTSARLVSLVSLLARAEGAIELSPVVISQTL